MNETKVKTKKTTVPKHIENKRTTIRVANTDIHIGEIYEVVGKQDLDAPSGFIENNTTKLLMSGIKEVKSVAFDENLQRYDTGFEINSPCNFRIPHHEKQALVDQYVKYIKEPYEEAYNKDVSAVNEDFWLGGEKSIPYMLEIYTGKKFDTSNAKDLFDLFHALTKGYVCEDGERDADLQRANYCIKNANKVISLQEERENNKFEAITTFGILLNTVDADKDDRLYTILEWMQIANIRNADKETLKRTFTKVIANEKTGYDSAKRFLEAYNISSTESGRKRMEIFSMLSKLQLKRKIEFKRNQYFLDEELLGNHLKGAAEMALKKPELEEFIVRAYEQYCAK